MVQWEWLGRWNIFLKSLRRFVSGFEFVKTGRSSAKDINFPLISIIQWLWPLWVIKGQMWICSDLRYAWHQSTISALLSNICHSKETWKLVTQFFINTRTSLTKGMSFPRISTIQWPTIGNIEASDVNYTKFKTILQAESPSIRRLTRLCSYCRQLRNPLECY